MTEAADRHDVHPPIAISVGCARGARVPAGSSWRLRHLPIQASGASAIRWEPARRKGGLHFLLELAGEEGELERSGYAS